MTGHESFLQVPMKDTNICVHPDSFAYSILPLKYRHGIETTHGDFHTNEVHVSCHKLHAVGNRLQTADDHMCKHLPSISTHLHTNIFTFAIMYTSLHRQVILHLWCINRDPDSEKILFMSAILNQCLFKKNRLRMGFHLDWKQRLEDLI